MTRTWITNSSSNVEAMVNSLNAACDEGFVPDDLYVVESPLVEEQVDRAIDHAATVVEAYGVDSLDVHLTTLEDEVDVESLQAYLKETVEAAKDRGDEVAVDITPGRKFMSAIAFAAGVRYDADHVYYFYLSSTRYFGRLYPEIPRTAVELYDFAEAV